jgi:uncharacterized membrane protein (DUF373 family)
MTAGGAQVPHFDASTKGWTGHTLYRWFEQLVSGAVLLLVAAIILYGVVAVAVALVKDFAAGAALDTVVMTDAFGLLLTILILLEFNHSIAIAMRRGIGAEQVRIVVLIAIVVIARKLILLDYKAATVQTLLGLGGLALALGGLHWILADEERRDRLAPRTE